MKSARKLSFQISCHIIFIIYQKQLHIMYNRVMCFSFETNNWFSINNGLVQNHSEQIKGDKSKLKVMILMLIKKPKAPYDFISFI